MGGVINIQIDKQHDTMCIHISFNGKGMGMDKLEILIMNDFKADRIDKVNLG